MGSRWWTDQWCRLTPPHSCIDSFPDSGDRIDLSGRARQSAGDTLKMFRNSIRQLHQITVKIIPIISNNRKALILPPHFQLKEKNAKRKVKWLDKNSVWLHLCLNHREYLRGSNEIFLQMKINTFILWQQIFMLVNTDTVLCSKFLSLKFPKRTSQITTPYKIFTVVMILTRFVGSFDLGLKKNHLLLTFMFQHVTQNDQTPCVIHRPYEEKNLGSPEYKILLSNHIWLEFLFSSPLHKPRSCRKNYQLRECSIEFACQVLYHAETLHFRQHVTEDTRVLNWN